MIFLDLVGTITDTEQEKKAQIYIGAEIKRRFSPSEPPEDIWNFIERCRRPKMESRDTRYIPIRELISDCLEKFLHIKEINMEETDKKWIKEVYISAHERYSAPTPSSMEALEIMKKLSEHLGLISDADADYLERVLGAMGILRFFDSISSSEEVGFGKPNPEIFRKAMEKSGDTGVFYHIGDSERRDVAGAIKVGMIPILISRERIVKTSAHHIARDLIEAALWIEGNIIKEKELR